MRKDIQYHLQCRPCRLVDAPRRTARSHRLRSRVQSLCLIEIAFIVPINPVGVHRAACGSKTLAASVPPESLGVFLRIPLNATTVPVMATTSRSEAT